MCVGVNTSVSKLHVHKKLIKSNRQRLKRIFDQINPFLYLFKKWNRAYKTKNSQLKLYQTQKMIDKKLTKNIIKDLTNRHGQIQT